MKTTVATLALSAVLVIGAAPAAQAAPTSVAPAHTIAAVAPANVGVSLATGTLSAVVAPSGLINGLQDWFCRRFGIGCRRG